MNSATVVKILLLKLLTIDLIAVVSVVYGYTKTHEANLSLFLIVFPQAVAIVIGVWGSYKDNVVALSGSVVLRSIIFIFMCVAFKESYWIVFKDRWPELSFLILPVLQMALILKQRERFQTQTMESLNSLTLDITRID